MKTFKEWLESIKDEDVRQRALGNCYADRLEYEGPSLDEALLCGFIWMETPEGHQYWDEQWTKALNNEL